MKKLAVVIALLLVLLIVGYIVYGYFASPVPAPTTQTSSTATEPAIEPSFTKKATTPPCNAGGTDISPLAVGADPYNPIPLRVATIGSDTFHFPFCPYAKNSLSKYGVQKRINFYTREQIALSKRCPCTYCLAEQGMSCEDMTPEYFSTVNQDEWCTPLGITAGPADEPVGKFLCGINGYLSIWTDRADQCKDGSVIQSVSDVGNILITMAYLNKINGAIGDATGDADVDADDVPYFNACVGKTTDLCLMVFDFNFDSQIDGADRLSFNAAMNTGNSFWARQHYPTAKIAPDSKKATEELPLRVGIEGSNLYHMIDCPSVKRSWDKYGIGKRIDFFTWDQVKTSRRLSDDKVCKSGPPV